MSRDIKQAAQQLRQNLKAKYASYFDQHGVYFALQARIEERMAKDVSSYIDGWSLEELTALADQWGEDGKGEAVELASEEQAVED